MIFKENSLHQIIMQQFIRVFRFSEISFCFDNYDHKIHYNNNYIFFVIFSFCIITRNDGIIKMRNEHSQLATTYISCLLILMYTFTLVEYMMMMTEIMFKLRAILNDLHPKLHNLRISR